MSRARKKEIRIRVVGQRRKEPDIRLIAKAIIRMSLDSEATSDQMHDLEATEKAIARRRKAAPAEPTEQVAP